MATGVHNSWWWYTGREGLNFLTSLLIQTSLISCTCTQSHSHKTNMKRVYVHTVVSTIEIQSHTMTLSQTENNFTLCLLHTVHAYAVDVYNFIQRTKKFCDFPVNISLIASMKVTTPKLMR